MSKYLKYLVAASAVIVAGQVQAAVSTYSNEAAFGAAAPAGATFESFETAVAGTTSVSFTGGTFSCSGSAYCPGFFGINTDLANTGSQSVFFASPDSATFTFDTPINAFGIMIGGAGDVAPITLDALLSNGDSAAALTDYSGSFWVFNTNAGGGASDGPNQQYFGVIDTTPFTSVTFKPSNIDDGIFFDSMTYGASGTPIPEPATLTLLGLALGGLGFMSRKKAA